MFGGKIALGRRNFSLGRHRHSPWPPLVAGLFAHIERFIKRCDGDFFTQSNVNSIYSSARGYNKFTDGEEKYKTSRKYCTHYSRDICILK